MSPRTEQFHRLVAQQPENELFRFSLAQALAHDGLHAEALPHYEYCSTKKADWMMAQIGRGKALLKLGRLGGARVALQAALQLAIEQQHEDPEREVRALLADLAP